MWLQSLISPLGGYLCPQEGKKLETFMGVQASMAASGPARHAGVDAVRGLTKKHGGLSGWRQLEISLQVPSGWPPPEGWMIHSE